MINLTPLQERFCQAYVTSGNAKDAYFAAGYSVKKDTAARVNSSRLLTNANIIRRIGELQEKASESSELSRAQIVSFLCKAVSTPIGEIDLTSPLCQSVEKSDRGQKLTMVSKLGAVDKLCRILGYYEPVKVEIGIEAKILHMFADLTGANKERKTATFEA